MKQRFHNFLLVFRKDSGAHFTYNIGVSLLRAGVIVFAFGVLIAVLSLMNVGRGLTSLGETRAAITGARREHYVTVTSFIEGIYTGDRKEYIYLINFSFEYGGEKISSTQRVPESSFRGYERLTEFDSVKLNLYKTRDGFYFLSYHDKKKDAEEEYLRGDPSLSFGEVSVILFFIAGILWLVGRREQRLAMKYPRSDVPLEEHSLVPADAPDGFETDGSETPTYRLTDDGEVPQ